MFDGSLASTAISETASIDVWFPSGELLPLTFYVTPLDSSCKAVLGFSFLTRYNPLIDWASKTITFRHTKQHVSSPQTSIPSGRVDRSETSHSEIPPDPPVPSVIPVTGSPCGNRSRLTKPRPLSERFPYEPIYTYPSVHQRASRLESSDVDIAFVGAAAFHRILKDTGSEPYLLHAVSPEVLA